MISEFVSLPCWHSWDWKIPCLSLWEHGVLSPTLSLGLSAISAKTFVTWVIISGVLMGSEPRERRRKWEREAEGEGGSLISVISFDRSLATGWQSPEVKRVGRCPQWEIARGGERERERTTEGLWRLSQSQSAGMSLTPPEEAVNWSAPLREREKRKKRSKGGGWRKSAFAEDVWRPIYSCKDTGRARPELRVPAHSNELCLYTPRGCLKIKTILEGRASALHVHHLIHLLTFSAFAYWCHRPCFWMYCTVQSH